MYIFFKIFSKANKENWNDIHEQHYQYFFLSLCQNIKVGAYVFIYTKIYPRTGMRFSTNGDYLKRCKQLFKLLLVPFLCGGIGEWFEMYRTQIIYYYIVVLITFNQRLQPIVCITYAFTG